MTAFISRCWKRRSAWLAGLWLAGGLALASLPAWAGSIEPRAAELRAADDGYVLSAEFAIDLGPRLEDAVTRGVALNFILEFVLERPRQYWIAEHIVTRLQTYKLSYSSLTRQFRLAGGALHQNFGSLDEALRALGHIGMQVLADKGALKPDEKYQAAVRLTLDRGQLPKPFQIDAITDHEWQIDAKVKRWTFQPAEPK